MIKIRNLEKSYGESRIINNISFQIEKGKPLAIIGRNGAGKSTIIKMLLGIVQSDNGSIDFTNDEKMNIGYLPEERGVYKNETVETHIKFFAGLSNMYLSKQELNIFLDKFELLKYKKMKLKDLSKGNAQKLQLAICLVNQPNFLILDEPFSGLDPINRKLFHQILNEQKKNTYIIFSSHQMDQIENFCESIIILKDGNLFFNGHKTDLQRDYGNPILKMTPFSNYELILNGYDFEIKDEYLYVYDIKDISKIKKIMSFVDNITEFRYEFLNLEQIYFKIMEGNDESLSTCS